MTVSDPTVVIRRDLDDFIFPFCPASVLVLSLKFVKNT